MAKYLLKKRDHLNEKKLKKKQAENRVLFQINLNFFQNKLCFVL